MRIRISKIFAKLKSNTKERIFRIPYSEPIGIKIYDVLTFINLNNRMYNFNKHRILILVFESPQYLTK